MAFDFPSSPTIGQVANGYTWDGEKWIMAGAGVLSVVQVKKFTASGTYTPDPNLSYAIIECQAGGGGGGGVDGKAGQFLTAGGGAGGGYARALATKAMIGATAAIVVGLGGTAGAIGGPGGIGGVSSVTSASSVVLASATGGGFGQGTSDATTSVAGASTGGVGTVGDLLLPGGDGGGGSGFATAGNQSFYCGFGGSSQFAGQTMIVNGASPGTAGKVYGGGASGAASIDNTDRVGAVGGAGIVVITEFCFSTVGGSSGGLSALRGYLSGLTFSTAGASATFAIAAGVACDSAHAAMMTLAAAISKTTAAWAVGSGNGALDTGAIAANTSYHFYLIQRPDTGVTDIAISLSPVAPTTGGNIPAAYTRSRCILSLKTDGSSQWPKVIQNGDLIMLPAPITDVAAINPGTAAVTRTMSCPTGRKFELIVHVTGSCSSGSTDSPGGIYLSDLDVTDAVAATSGASSVSLYVGAAAIFQLGTDVSVMSNASAQIRSRIQTSTAGATIYLMLKGWRDRRGRDA